MSRTNNRQRRARAHTEGELIFLSKPLIPNPGWPRDGGPMFLVSPQPGQTYRAERRRRPKSVTGKRWQRMLRKTRHMLRDVGHATVSEYRDITPQQWSALNLGERAMLSMIDRDVVEAMFEGQRP